MAYSCNPYRETDVSLSIVAMEIAQRLERKREERRMIESINAVVTRELYHEQIMNLVEKYSQGKKSKKTAVLLGEEIGRLLPSHVTKWFEDTYNFGYDAMLDLYMNDDTLSILKLHLWCAEIDCLAWKEVIPLYVSGDIASLRKLAG